MSWPDSKVYQHTLQHPEICFYDPELRAGQVALGLMGMPHLASGEFASVCKIHSGKKQFAVKCFIKEVPDRRRRYEHICQHLKNHQLPWLVWFEYQEKGIQVQGKPYPIVKMEWVDGVPLHTFIEEHLGNANVLYSLAQQFYELVMDLQRARIGHGDLHHDNILVSESTGQLRLIDYDGMFVPSLRGEQALEQGYPNYQHPKRTTKDYNEAIDNFSALVIYLSLRALVAQPELWHSFHKEKNLIFLKEDFELPGQTPIWQQLRQCSDIEVRQLAEILEQACVASPAQLPNLETILQESRKPPKPLWEDTITGDIENIEKRLHRFLMESEGNIRKRLLGKSQVLLSCLIAGVRIGSMAVMVGFLLGFPVLLIIFILNSTLRPLIARGTRAL